MKRNILFTSFLFISFAFFLISACVPVAIMNRNLDSTYVYLKFSPDETCSAIKNGTTKGTILIDDAYLPPRYSKHEGQISHFLIIPHGKHKLTINAGGYRTWEKDIFFSGRHVTLNVQLEKN